MSLLRFELSVALVVCVVIPQLALTQFQWLEKDSFYDCIVGISIGGVPSGIGVFIDPANILTSASPLHKLFDWTSGSFIRANMDKNNVTVHAIDGSWRSSKALEVSSFVGNQGNRGREPWVKIGLDHLHTTIFDIFVIFVTNATATFSRYPSSDRNLYYAQSTFAMRAYNNITLFLNIRRPLHSAAFGYYDKSHINDSYQLRAKQFEQSSEVGCDEWVPRRWGRFLCIVNEEDSVGVQSGAPLFRENMLMGVGAFELNKGNESILVFTDLRYIRNILFMRHISRKP